MTNSLKLAALLYAAIAAAQDQPKPPTFEVAAIKPNHTGDKNSGFRRAGPSQLNAINATLKMLISYAYDVRDYRITGGPYWLDSDRYDILAKPEPGADPESMTPAARTALLRLRLQSLLADRFQLRLHHTTKELPTFALVVAKNGPKLTESKLTRSEMFDNGHHLTCRKVSMATLSKIFLQDKLGRFVVDQTGLTGEYDFNLDWAPDDAQPPTQATVEGVSLFTALQEQLGLKLESQKGSVDILIIDHAEAPSEN